MISFMSIVTRTGDKGETGLFGGQRVGKDDIRMEVIGTIDELNAVLGLARTIPDQTSKLYEQSGAFIGILGAAHSSRDFVKVGRLMQRIWLAGTSLGLSLHPVGAVLFFKKGIDDNTTDAFSDADKALVHRAHKGIFDSFSPQSDDDVLFVFRAGIAKAPPSASTVRLRLADILIQ